MSEPNVQTKKRQMMSTGGAVIGTLGLVGAGMFLFDSGPVQHREKPKIVSIIALGTVDSKDARCAQQVAKEKSNETLIGEVKTQLKAQEEQNKKLAQALEKPRADKTAAGSAGNATAAKPDASVLDKPLPIGSGTGPGQRVLQPPSGKGGTTTLSQPLNQADMPARREVEIITFNNAEGKGTAGVAVGGTGGITEVLGFPTDEKTKKYGTTSGGIDGKKQTIEFLPAGSFVRVVMLNGVDAPTGRQAQPGPLPVAFRALDIANLANKHKPDIKDCRIVAAAWGDLSSEQIMGRTEALACVINDEAVEMTIKGQVIGEGGRAGVRGRLVTKQGQLLANVLFADAFSGTGKVFQSSVTITSTGDGGITQTIDPDKTGQATIGGGVSSAGQQLAQYYLRAADKLYPVIETDGGRTVEIFIIKGVVYLGRAFAEDDHRGLLKCTGTNSRKYENDQTSVDPRAGCCAGCSRICPR